MLILIEILIKITGYSLILFSFWLMALPLIEPFLVGALAKIKRRKRTNRYRRLAYGIGEKHHNATYRHLQLLLHSIQKEMKPNAVVNFIFLMVVLFSVSSLIIFLMIRDLILAWALGGLFGALPYVMARIKLSALRSRNSIAFLKTFHILLSNYQSTGKDIYFTMVNSIQQTKEPELKMVFIKLVNSMQIQKSRSEFNQAVQVFIFSVDSHFAKRFGKLLLKAHLAQADIFKSFIQLDSDIRKRKIDIEEEATRNQDTVWQGYFPIVALPLAFFFSYQMSGVLHYWTFFTQKQNLSLFIVCLVLSILSVLMANVLRKPKADI